MDSYETAVAFGWIMMIVGFFGALLSTYDWYTSIYLLPIFLIVILAGNIVWYYAVKTKKMPSTRKWANPKILADIIMIITAGNIVLWAVIYGLKAIIIRDTQGSDFFIGVALLSIPFVIYVIFSVIYIIFSLKIKRMAENEQIQ